VPADKGKFSADISQKVIEEALKSVHRHSTGAPAEVPIEVEVPDGPPPPSAAAVAAAAVAAPVAAEPAAPVDPKDKEIEQLQAQLDFSMAKGRELMDKIKDGHEKMLRAVADLENFRKRALKEKEEIQRYGAERLLKDLLPVIDNLDRGLDHAKAATDFDSFRTGVAQTRKLFEDTMGRHGVKSFSAAGKAFDPRLHEAMQQVETTELPPNQVVNEILRGYMLNERLVRPALVMVSKAPAPVVEAPAPVVEEPKPGEGTGNGSPPEPAAGS
jgi:molecular chaperone GrpE